MRIDFRTLLLLLLVAISLYLIISPYLMKRQGVIVSSVDNPDCTLKAGDIINSILGQQINSIEDFNRAVKNVKKGERVTMVVNNGPGGCTALGDGYLGVNITNVPSEQLKFGIELQGGVVTLLKPEKDVSTVVEILRKRVAAYMIPDAQVLVNGNTIKVVSLSSDVIPALLERGKFEATILEGIELTNNIGDIPIGDNVYTVEVVDGSLKVNGSFYTINSTFQLEDVVFTVKNITNSSVVVEAKFFSNADVLRTFGSGTLSYNSDSKMYEFTIPIEISEEASRKFNKILKNAPTYFDGRQTVVDGFLVYYIDEKPISSLIIPAELIKQEMRQLSVVGFSTSLSDASITKQKVFASLESGEMPTSIKVAGFEAYKPTMQNLCLMIAGLSFICFLVVSLTVFYFRYKKMEVGPLVIVLTLTCVFITLGFVALVQKFLPIWVVNFQTFLGFVVLMFVSLCYSVITAEARIRKNAPKIILLRRSISLASLTDFLTVVVALVLLFTFLKFFATTLLVGFLIYRILVVPLYEKRL